MIKTTPQKLVQAWNLIGELIELNEDPQFTAQSRRLLMQMRDNVKLWNDLSVAERQAIGEQEITLQADKVKSPPKFYSNDHAELLEPFFEKGLERKTVEIEELLKKTEVNGEVDG